MSELDDGATVLETTVANASDTAGAVEIQPSDLAAAWDDPLDKAEMDNARINADDEIIDDSDDSDDSEGEDEAVADSDEESDDSDDSDEDDSAKIAGLDDRTQASVNKRISKEVAKTKAAKELVEGLQAELDEMDEELKAARQGNVAPTNPVEAGKLAAYQVENKDELLQFEAQYQANVDQISQYAQTGYDPDDGGEHIGPEQVAQFREYHQARLNDVRQALRTFDDRVAKRDEAEDKFPAMFERGTKMHAARKTLLRQHPELHALPERDLFVGHFLAGQDPALNYDVKTAKNSKKTATKNAPRVPASAGASKSAVTAKTPGAAKNAGPSTMLGAVAQQMGIRR